MKSSDDIPRNLLFVRGNVCGRVPALRPDGSEENTVVALDEESETCLSKLGYAPVPLRTLISPESTERAINWFNELSDKQFLSPEVVRFIGWRGIPLWGFMQSYLFSDTKALLDMVEAASTAVERFKPTKITYAIFGPKGPAPWEIDVIQSVAETKGIEAVPVLNETPALLSLSTRLKRKALELVYDFEFRLATVCLTAVSKLVNSTIRRSLLKGDKTVAFFSVPRGWHSGAGPGEKGEDIYVNPVIKAMRRDYPDLRLVAINAFFEIGFHKYPSPYRYVLSKEVVFWVKKSLEQILGDPLIAWYPFHSFILARHRREAKRLTIELSTVLDNKELLRGINADLTYLGSDISKPMVGLISRYIKHNSEDVFSYLLAAEEVLVAQKVKAALVIYETGPYGKSISVAGNRKGIPIAGLQHGIIHKAHPDYMHRPVSNDPLKQPLAVPIPTVTALYGHGEQEVLTKIGSYPPEALKVTGQPRYDRLVQLSGAASAKSDARRALDLPSEVRILLVLSTGDEFTVELESFISASADLDMLLLWKTHPAQSDRPVKDLLQKNQVSAVVVNDNLENSILAADVVITKNSTTGIEAMILNRDLVVVNFSGQPDPMPYAEEGGAVGVYQPENLVPAIRNILDSPSQREALREGRRGYLTKRLVLDPPASSSVAELLVSLMAEDKSLDGPQQPDSARVPSHPGIVNP